MKATKKELEQALEVIEKAHDAETPAEIKAVVKQSDKLEDSTKDKALASKVDAIVSKIVDSDEKDGSVAEGEDGKHVAGVKPDGADLTDKPAEEELSPEEKKEAHKERLSRIAGGSPL